MGRYLLEIKFDGTNYHGWQVQENANTVQGEINQALSTLLQTEVMITGAGRTDTGVHAKQLFAHFDGEIEMDIQKLTYKLNGILPDDISLTSLQEVTDEFHARFSATSRTYEYWISPKKDPFLINRAWFFPYSLDIELMNEASKHLLKHTDFTCFSKSKTDTFTNDCDVSHAEWEARNDKLIFTISANRFLRNMVRAIVGTLVEVGQHKITPSDFVAILHSKDRSEAGISAPAHGLYLTNVNYPKEVFHG
jgi:tRNA pseudouridine38-40 synthase